MNMSSRTGNPGSKDQEGAHSSCSYKKAKEHTSVVSVKDADIQRELTIFSQQKGVEEATSD